MSHLVEFLLARIAEDEAAARAEDADYAHTSLLPTYDSDHQVRWCTERVLAECETKRAIVGRHTQKAGQNLPSRPICAECGGADWKPIGGVLEPLPWVMPWPCHTLRLLAAPYRDHPEFDQSWAVPE